MASGDTLCIFFPADGEPPSSNYASLDTRNGVLVLDFDDTTQESIDFAGFMPRHYDGGGVTLTIGWAATDTTVTPHNAVWEAQFASVGDDTDDLDGSLFAAIQHSGAVAEASVSGELSYDTITFTDGAQMDSVAAGEYFRLRVARDSDDTNATDSLTGDAELAFIELKET